MKKSQKKAGQKAAEEVIQIPFEEVDQPPADDVQTQNFVQTDADTQDGQTQPADAALQTDTQQTEEPNAQSDVQAANAEQTPQEALQSEAQPVEQTQSDDAQSAAEEQPLGNAEIQTDAKPADEEVVEEALFQAETQPDDNKKKKKKGRKAEDGGAPEKEGKVRLYVESLFKYFNIITILPLALIMYAVFFASYVVDRGNLFNKNIVWICIILGIAAVVMVAWFITTIKKRRVCSFDAFLLMALLICGSMIAQCVIFKNFMSFDGIAIATLAATVAVLLLLTIRLIMFKPAEQKKDDDAKYSAKGKLGMYFKVIFAKYSFFIAMLCVIGALLILILTQSNIFEVFEFEASNLEQIVVVVFAALAAVLMILSIFIRIVRGRANVVDCMPYMFFIIAIGGLIFFMKKQTYMILYVAIGAAVIGAVWLSLCQYTLLVSHYRKSGEIDSDDADAQPSQQIVEEQTGGVQSDESIVEEQSAEQGEQTGDNK